MDEGRRKAQAKLQGEMLALLRAHGYQSERIGNLSTKLRLTNQSRWSGRKADQQARRKSRQARSRRRIRGDA